jgi:hypothetical protein
MQWSNSGCYCDFGKYLGQRKFAASLLLCLSSLKVESAFNFVSWGILSSIFEQSESILSYKIASFFPLFPTPFFFFGGGGVGNSVRMVTGFSSNRSLKSYLKSFYQKAL